MTDEAASPQNLKGKIALVTGGARGIGFETSRQLCECGAIVIIAARSRAMADAAAARLRADGHEAHGLALDVAKDEDRKAAFNEIDRSHGVLDILVNNAAIYLESADASTPPSWTPSATPLDVLRETFEVNFFGPFALTQALLPLLRRASAGRIVNVSSVRGSLTLQSDPSSADYISSKAIAYDASKTALNAFTVQLAAELRGAAIKVNAIHPGWVRTEMGGALANLSPAEGARTTVQFASLSDDGPTGGFFFMDERLPW
jgi:NAD(P)-dependent dehydrogenase (short-subunit alcohol dehydrogenase family)